MSDYQVEISTEQTEFLVIFIGEPVADTWCSLYAVPPTDTSPGVELSVPGYQREPIIWVEDAGNARFSAQVESTVIAAVGMMDAQTGGNLLFYKDIPDMNIPFDTIIDTGL